MKNSALDWVFQMCFSSVGPWFLLFLSQFIVNT